MALTPTIQVSQANALVGLAATMADIRASELNALVAYNFPTEEIRASNLLVSVGLNTKPPVHVSQLEVLVAGRGRVFNPNMRCWTYSLDGHDFYVLRLGDDNTLVYDLTTQTWSRFTSGDMPFWRANTGTNWIDANSLAFFNGSNVLVGDDVFGTLYFLDPDQGYDESPQNSLEFRTFPRAATGQVVAKTREYQPVYEVWLNCSNGLPTFTNQTVDLKYSDDAGRTYVSAQPIVVEEGNYVQDISWMSLGRFCYPGRLFRIEDDGALARIDGMDVNNGLSTS